MDLKTWRDNIVTQLKNQVTNATDVRPTSDPELTISLGGWSSPVLWVELRDLISDGSPRLVDSGEQDTEMEANVYVAVRTAEINETLQRLEYNEEVINVGLFDLVSDVMAALKKFDVQQDPIVRMFVKNISDWAKTDDTSIWRLSYALKGNYT
jgi:hypothetical protein